MGSAVATFIMCTVMTFGFAWAMSATTISKECDTIGMFYVGTSVYKCEKVK